MGVDVVLKRVSRAGTSPKRRRLTQVDVVPDGSDVFAGICGRSGRPLLGRVDPYGTLVLTARDMPHFDAERGGAVGAAERDVLDGVRGLADRCAVDATPELHLEGD
ncbi:hypothetical protein [Streptomyces brasiliensis]|uniref:Uncharacterized protein n=1 Tax=Streptomyces brasiliensis TaxID=1954 RepID=A0A917L7V7_9ACTN|nr:hypothetical protein [Streptomyces brasiliensis]GGJ46837.1 hypothetical protein GCM10010121_067660 [Streptomyces brasiliensis]